MKFNKNSFGPPKKDLPVTKKKKILLENGICFVEECSFTFDSDAAELVFANMKPPEQDMSSTFSGSPTKLSHITSPLSGIPYGDSFRLSDTAKR